ncbi:cTPxI [Tulasnella sp. 427]|nr:cTPxI [Tulasnella sp. 427]
MVALIQRPAPAFSGTVVEDSLFKQISLQDYLGKWVVLFFYPICPTEILAFNKALPEFAAINATVIACSTDNEYSHLAWANLEQSQGGLGPNLKLLLLADRSHKISKDYGVLLEDEGITLRGLFIIDPKGILRQITINDLPVGRSVEETLRLIKAFQYVEIHGEGCPANWTQGKDTIKLDPKGKLEWFEKQLNPEPNGTVAVNGTKRVADGDIEMNGAKKARA